MELEPIIKQLQATLPVLSPYFSSELQISSITNAALVATVETAVPHNLSANTYVTMANIMSPVIISTATESPSQIEFLCATPHDLTLSARAEKDQNQMVRITSASFDQTYLLKEVKNRYRFIVERSGQPSLPIGETLSLQEQAVIGYNGLKQIIDTPTTTSFTFSMDFDFPDPNFIDGAVVKTGVRISGGIDLETIEKSYSKQLNNELWLFVLPQDATANKSRNTPIDSQSSQGVQGDFRQYIIDGFELYLFVPNKGDVLTKTNGRFAWDLVQAIKPSLFRSILGLTFESGLACQGQEIITYNNDKYVDYNGAYYIHQFSFQAVLEITKDDTANQDFTRAFRDILVTHRNQFSDLTTYTSQINLDVEPETP